MEEQKAALEASSRKRQKQYDALVQGLAKEVEKGDALKGYKNNIIRVVGHSDNMKLAKSLQATFPTNGELSVSRATNVVRFLQESGIPPSG